VPTVSSRRPAAVGLPAKDKKDSDMTTSDGGHGNAIWHNPTLEPIAYAPA
jgi:hypothetical protein